MAAVCHICCVTEDFFLPPQCHISAGHWLFTTPTSHRRRQMLLAEQTPGSLPGVWRAAHCPAWRNTPCTSTEWPILWWYPRQHRHKASFPEIPSGKCNDKIGFIYLFTYLPIYLFYLFTQITHYALLQLMLRDQCCRDQFPLQSHGRGGQTLPSNKFPPCPEELQMIMSFHKFPQTPGNIQFHKNVIPMSRKQWIFPFLS